VLKKLGTFFRRPKATPKALAGRQFVLDGTNITLLHGRENPEIRYVLAICDYLEENGGEFECFFDANTRHIIKDYKCDQVEAFDKFTSEEPWSEHVHVVPSGTQADQWILKRAKRDGSDVISNDRFRDRAKENKWIWKRRHAMLIVEGRMTLPSLDADFSVLPSAGEYLQKTS
jgi:hypothetical protein